MPNQDIIFFDGQCNLCDRFVNFVFKRDLKKQFLYASLQSQTAKQHLKREDIESLKSIVFLQKGQALKKTLAIQSIMKRLYPRWAFALSVAPLFLFNIFYNIIAKKRYALFGKKKSLYQPTTEQKKYFLP